MTQVKFSNIYIIYAMPTNVSNDQTDEFYKNIYGNIEGVTNDDTKIMCTANCPQWKHIEQKLTDLKKSMKINQKVQYIAYKNNSHMYILDEVRPGGESKNVDKILLFQSITDNFKNKFANRSYVPVEAKLKKDQAKSGQFCYLLRSNNKLYYGFVTQTESPKDKFEIITGEEFTKKSYFVPSSANVVANKYLKYKTKYLQLKKQLNEKTDI